MWQPRIYIESLKVLLTAAAVHQVLISKISGSPGTYMVAWARGWRGGGSSSAMATAYGVDERRSRLASSWWPTAPVECGKDTLLDTNDTRCDNSVIAMYRMINSEHRPYQVVCSFHIILARLAIANLQAAIVVRQPRWPLPLQMMSPLPSSPWPMQPCRCQAIHWSLISAPHGPRQQSTTL